MGVCAVFQIEGQVVKKGLPMKFHERCDHLDSNIREYKVSAACKEGCTFQIPLAPPEVCQV